MKTCRIFVLYSLLTIGVEDERAGGTCSPRIREKIFFGQLLCKIRAFFRQDHLKFGDFVNFPEK